MRAGAIWLSCVLIIIAASVFVSSRPKKLPAGISRHLDSRYPGWQYARLNEFNRRQLLAGQDPARVQGDYNGDGRTDWAVQITHSGDPFRQQSILVFLAGPERHEVHAIHTVSENEGTYLGRRPGGSDRDVVEDTAVLSRGDILDVLFGQEAGIAYLYREGRFVSYTTGD